MTKGKKVHTHTMDSDPAAFIKMLIHLKADFIVKNSNYTVEIETKNEKHKYLTTLRNLEFFGLSSQLKKYYRDHPEIVEKCKTDALVMSKPEYFSSKPYQIPFEAQRVINIDLKAAYPNILRIYDMISPELYRKMMQLDKNTRLQVLGSIAGTKTIFQYHQGECVNTAVDESEFKPVFMFAVRNCDFIMEQIAQILGQFYIFYWVDGIYLQNDVFHTQMQEIDSLMAEMDLEWSISYLTDFKCKRIGDNISFEYKKDGRLKGPLVFPDKTLVMEKKKIRDYFLESTVNI
jgi:hypothetical protein